MTKTPSPEKDFAGEMIKAGISGIRENMIFQEGIKQGKANALKETSSSKYALKLVEQGQKSEQDRCIDIIQKKIGFLDNQDTSKMTNHQYKVMNMLRKELVNIISKIQQESIK